jgi:hypothetical protein
MSQIATKWISDGAVLSGTLAAHGKIGSGAATSSQSLFSDGSGGTTFRSISGSDVSGGTLGVVNGSAITNLSAANISGVLPVGVTGGSGLSIATTQLTGSVSLTTQVSGILPGANGGTGLSSITQYEVVIGGAANTLTQVASVGTSGQVLTSAGAGAAPTWQTPTITPGDITLTDNHIFVGNASNLAADVAMSGDATIVASGALTLATVNADVGTFGDASDVPVITVNGKGLITAITTSAVVAPAGTLSGTTLNSTVVSSSLTSVGTIATGTWNGTTIAIANGGTGQTTAAAAFNALDPMTTTGDMIYESATNVASRLPIGTTGEVLTVVGGVPAWAATAATATNAKDTFVLSGTDITNQFVTLTHTPLAGSTDLLIQGAGDQLEGASYDYVVSGAQIQFKNGLATGGVSALVAGDILQVQYEY